MPPLFFLPGQAMPQKTVLIAPAFPAQNAEAVGIVCSSALEQALPQTALLLSVPGDGFPRMPTARRVLQTVMEFSAAHPQVTVSLLCPDETVLAAYRFQWNMWYQAEHPEELH